MKCILTQMEAKIAHQEGFFIASKIIVLAVPLEC